MSEAELRMKICEVGSGLVALGLIGGIEGNITCRLGGAILATPAGVRKGKLRPEDIVKLDPEGAPLSDGKASSEIALHLRIYKERADVDAVVHAHPPFATAFAVAGETLPERVMPECDFMLGAVPLVPFAVPGTTAMGDAIAPVLGRGKAFLLANHGAVTVGASLEEAHVLMETLERVARVYLYARLLGTPQPLPPDGVRWLDGF
jgi:L-fuculose-phosphate aldolase